ncbi:SIS domain-containing protein [Cupriavidus sp. WKF15]|uniref:SIS domain-containing protein n=1 Tax=Cupriavidus sp. WKF15 TaxID=3032282 RepID=UPI0023E1C37C|nr:SIS domain-containing protein [Cupriavidus sp. WKF15]WER47610.1 SIS domain-containing protein [Cupriavidus sp. WKF15]
MLEEALSAPAVVAAQLEHAAEVAALAEALAAQPWPAVLTVARGSSDHAASYFAALVTRRLGVPVASLPMSTVTLHASALRVAGQLAVAFSQSGRSPDLVETMRALRAGGAQTLALVNAPGSPLAHACEHALPLRAGAEHSVAATKSYIAMLSQSALLVGHLERARTGAAALADACAALPLALRMAATLDWSALVPALRGARQMLVLGRGPGLAVAQEAALKLKETSGIQAEAFSGAEVRHGPMELIGAGYPLLVFAPRGPEQQGLLMLAAEMRARGARVLLAAPAGTPDADLPLAEAAHPLLDPIAAIQSFYLAAEALARARGRHPDQPRYLSKVTETR